MTLSCNSIDLEKQIVLLANLLSRVLKCQRQFKIDPLINVIAEVKLTHPRN